MAFILVSPSTLRPQQATTSARPYQHVCHPRMDVNVDANASPTSMSRRAFLSVIATASAAAVLVPTVSFSEDLELSTVTTGKGPSPAIGDLVGVRFKGMYNGVVFDNLFESTEPYFYRVGAGSVLKGIDEAVLNMTVGQIVNVTIPAEKAFGSKGRRASPGKPAIPPNATVNYTIELTTIPGKESELLEDIADSDIGSSL